MENGGEQPVSRRDILKKIARVVPKIHPSTSRENSSSELPGVTRRTVLKGAAAAGVAAVSHISSPVAFADQWWKEAHEQKVIREVAPPFVGDVSFAIIKGQKRRDREYAFEVIQKALQESPSDIILTPEYTFYDEKHPIRLKKTSQGFELDSQTDSIQTETVAKLQKIAVENKCHIFASTFYEAMDEPNISPNYASRNTLLHIDTNGKIVGIKRKMFPPEGDFTVKKNGHEYKVLPIICGEIMEMSVIDQEASAKQRKNVHVGGVQEWVKQGGPYDILLHPQEQADFIAPAAATALQNGAASNPEETRALETFHVYYDPYIPYLKNGAPIATADVRELAGVFAGDQKPLNSYSDTPNYTIARIQR